MSQVDAPPDPAAAVGARASVASRPLVIALAGLVLLVAAVFAWATFGRAPQTVTGFGYIVPDGGFTEVGTTVSGLVESVSVEPGQRVRAGEELVRVVSQDSGSISEYVVSPTDGVVVEVVALPGRVTDPGDPMVYLQPDGTPLIVKAFIAATSSETITPGMSATVSPADAPRKAQYGVILGTVSAISPTPVTAERISFVVGGNATLVDYFLAAGPVIEVAIEMRQDPSTPSGYAWSIGQGPDIEVTAGTLSEATVMVRDTPVIGWFTQ